MREVYEMVASQTVYVVPNFISEGYFCQQVLPRELQLSGPISQVKDKTVYYCDPVGVHRNMTRLLLQRADEVAAGVPRSQTSLVIVGHGTSLNDNSTKAIKDQVSFIREGGYGFAEVVDAYMEEAPFVAEWDKMTTQPHVVVVPFFIADGLHSYQDIPVLLGMEAEPTAAASQREVFRHNPHALRGRSVYYSSAIGTERLMAEVILDQVADFDAKHGISEARAEGAGLSKWLDQTIMAKGGQLMLGEACIQKQAEGGYRVTHCADVAEQGLALYTSAEDARAVANTDAAGEFRPLKTAPNLKRGWQLLLTDTEALLLALDYLYPAQVALARSEAAGELQAVPLRHMLGRQTGMYRFSNGIKDEQAGPMVSRVCADTKCARRILWDLTVEQPLDAPEKRRKSFPEGHLPLLCIEACTHIVGEARKVARQNHEAAQTSVAANTENSSAAT
jgi:sirohydrochlorin cobaltochelatase